MGNMRNILTFGPEELEEAIRSLLATRYGIVESGACIWLEPNSAASMRPVSGFSVRVEWESEQPRYDRLPEPKEPS